MAGRPWHRPIGLAVTLEMLAQLRAERSQAHTGNLVGVRLRPPLLAALDAFVKEHDEHPSRPEAVRLILADALTAYGPLPAPEESELNGGQSVASMPQTRRIS